MSAKKIPIAPIFMDLPTVAQVVAMSTATIERLEREGQFPKRRQLSGQRVVWLMHTGRWPDGEIDHINGVRDDNRIENLRDVTHQTNAENRRRPVRASETGALGVTLTKDGRYRARICSKGRLLSLGVFGSADEAHAAYVLGKRRLHAGNTL